MRGLIYKDISIFFKSIDKKLILIAAAAIVLLIFNAGISQVMKRQAGKNIN